MEIKIDKKYNTLSNTYQMGTLLQTAANLGIDISGYGELAVNQQSGNTYLWLEDYIWTLYITYGAKTKVSVLWSCPNCGNEIARTLNKLDTIDSLDEWASSLMRGKDLDCCEECFGEAKK